MGNFNKKIFGKKKFSDILEEIYNNQKKREDQVTALISELKPLVQEIGDATLIVPLIKEYMEIIEAKKRTVATLENLKKFTKNKMMDDRLKNAIHASGS